MDKWTCAHRRDDGRRYLILAVLISILVASSPNAVAAPFVSGSAPDDVFEPSVALDDKGQATVAWARLDAGQSMSLVEAVRQRADGSWDGVERVAEASNDGYFGASLGVDRAGTVTVAASTGYGVFSSSTGPNGWSASTLFSGRVNPSDDAASLAVAPNGRAVVVWKNLIRAAGQTRYALSSVIRGTTGRWGRASRVSTSSVALDLGQVAASDRGFAVAWTARRRNAPALAYLAIAGNTGRWGAPRLLAKRAYDSGVAMNRRGDAVAWWLRSLPGRKRVELFVVRSRSGGGWSKPRRLTVGYLSGVSVHAVVRDDGVPVVAWWDDRKIRMSWTQAGRWIRAKTVDRRAAFSTTAMVTAGPRGAYLIWQRPANASGSRRSVYSALLTGRRLGGRTRVTTIGNLTGAYDVDIASNARGRVVAAWSRRNAGRYRVQADRIR